MVDRTLTTGLAGLNGIDPTLLTQAPDTGAAGQVADRFDIEGIKQELYEQDVGMDRSRSEEFGLLTRIASVGETRHEGRHDVFVA